MKRVSVATVDSMEDNQIQACQPNYLQINLKLQIATELAKLLPNKTPKGNKLQTITINSRPLHESVISVRWLSAGGV